MIFGNSSKELWQQHEELSRENLNLAFKWSEETITAGRIVASMMKLLEYGGTNGCKILIAALKKMKERKISENQTVLLLTDGEFTDKEDWDSLRKEIQCSKVRIHTIAIETKYFNSIEYVTT